MPVTIGLIAAGTQAAGGLAQTLLSGRNKRQAELEDYAKQSPFYKPSKSIQDYYQEALNRYRESPYQSAQYQAAQQGIQRGMATALSNLQGWGASVAGASKLAQSQADALTRLGANIEAQRAQRLGQLGQAAQAQTAEQARAFDINQMTPYNRMLQLKQMKAQAAAEQYNAGLQTAAGGLGNLAMIGAQAAGVPKITPFIGTSSQETFNTWMNNPATKPQIDTSLIPTTPQMTLQKKLFGASQYIPNSYTTY